MQAYGGVDVYIHIFLTSALVHASCSDRFTPGEKAPPLPVELEVGRTSEPVWATLRKLLTLPGLKLRPLSRPARSQLLYRLCYPG
jgi:hypothetical protein